MICSKQRKNAISIFLQPSNETDDRHEATGEPPNNERAETEAPSNTASAEIGIQCEIWSKKPKRDGTDPDDPDDDPDDPDDPKDPNDDPKWIPNGARIGHRLNIDLFSNTQYIGQYFINSMIHIQYGPAMLFWRKLSRDQLDNTRLMILI